MEGVRPGEVADSAGWELRKKGRKGSGRVAKGTRNERRWSVVTANYTIVGRLTMEQPRAASRRNEFFLRFESRGLF